MVPISIVTGRPVTLRRIRDPSGRQPSEIAPTQVPFAASR